MAEENDPAVSDELVEVDGAIGSICLEVGSNASKTKPVQVKGKRRVVEVLVTAGMAGIAGMAKLVQEKAKGSRTGRAGIQRPCLIGTAFVVF